MQDSALNYYEIAVMGHNLEILTFESEREIKEGRLVLVLLKNRQKEGVILKKTTKPTFKTSPILETTNKFFSKEQMELAKFLSSYYICEFGLSIALFEPFEEGKEKAKTLAAFQDITLSLEQTKAYEFAKTREVSLVFGDTGSGKTEIYMKLMADTLANQKSVIFLTPEISLTPQAIKRLSDKFGDLVGAWHSKQTKKTKTAALEAIKESRIRIVAGPRSALFLPVENIGLIIVDEEHDDSYKSNSSPRYNAKDMAVVYAKLCGAKCVLGSATPSLSSYKNFEFFRLRESFFKSDKRFIFEPKETGMDEYIVSNVVDTVSRGEQAIIFLPTRANFKYIVCKSCGKSVECPFCSVSMSLHLSEGALKCHYCGYAEKIEYKCKECGHGEMGVFRIGTQEALERLQEAAPNISLKKFDRDEITTQNKLEKTLKEFEVGKISVLVGTQMLSKGHDYHSVSLAVVLGLDSILAQNDFRAKERALSLLVQIAGRAGRSGSAKVIVQTLNGEFFGAYIKDYELFLKDELKARGALYPPNARMVRLLFASTKKERAEGDMLRVLEKLKTLDIEVVGYGEAPISMIAKKHRFDILARSPSASKLLRAIHSADDKSFEADMDPISFS